jgi:hypothetical protein
LARELAANIHQAITRMRSVDCLERRFNRDWEPASSARDLEEGRHGVRSAILPIQNRAPVVGRTPAFSAGRAAILCVNPLDTRLDE